MSLSRIRMMVLLSVGRHPITARPRRADLDARALELALRVPEAEVLAVHAGLADREALQGYLGMGLKALTVLEIAADQDPYGVLVQHAKAIQPDLVLCGARADAGEASGYLPYALAHALDLPMVAHISGFERVPAGIRLLQALPRGRRRLFEGQLPMLMSVSPAAPRPRQSAFARARRARLDIVRYPEAPQQAAPAVWHVRPARPKPKRLSPILGQLSGEERLKAMIEGTGRGGEVLKGLSPDVAAERLLEYLKAERVLQ